MRETASASLSIPACKFSLHSLPNDILLGLARTTNRGFVRTIWFRRNNWNCKKLEDGWNEVRVEYCGEERLTENGEMEEKNGDEREVWAWICVFISFPAKKNLLCQSGRYVCNPMSLEEKRLVYTWLLWFLIYLRERRGVN